MISAAGLGYAGGVLVENKNVAVGLIPVFIIPLMLLSGFFVNQNNVVPVLKPFEYISFFKYGFQVYTYNEYEGLELQCSPNCDPIKTLDFEETMGESVIATACVGAGFYTIGYIFIRIMAYRAR